MKPPQPRTVGLVGGLLGLAAAGTAVGVAATRAASSRVRADRVGPVPGDVPLPPADAPEALEAPGGRSGRAGKGGRGGRATDVTDLPAEVQRADDPLGSGSRPADRTSLVHATDGVLLHVEEVGPTDAPLTVVLVHGYTLSMASWTFQRRDLGRAVATGNGHAPQARLVFYDQRGHGASARGDAAHSTVDQLAEDLVSVLDACVPRGPVVLVGHSMGGMTVLQLAARRPDLFGGRVVGVGLVSTSAGGLGDLDLGLPGVLTRVRAAVFPVAGFVMRHRPTFAEWIRRSAADVVSWATRALSFAGDEVDPRLVDYVDAMIGGTPVEVIAEFYPAIVGLDAEAAIAPLAHVPVLVLTGDEDKLIPQGHSDRLVAELTAAGARDVRYRVVPHSGHLVLLEHPDEVTAAITELVRRAGAR